MAKRKLPFADDVDGAYYYAMYPDVAAANVPPARHYHRFGWHEGRNPDSYFDTLGYLATYKDVAAAGIDPLAHFHRFGWREGREPSPAFDAQAYLAANPDVAAAGIDPLGHYLRFGRSEGRQAIAKPLYDADGTANAVNEHAGSGTATGVTFSWGGFISPNLKYTLIGDTSGGGFQVNASTGAVTIADPSKVDYNTSGASHSYTVTVQASDLGHTIIQTAVIAIRDVNDFAPVFTSGTTGQEAENTAASNVVYKATATDADGTAPNNTVTYGLTAGVGDNDQFTINPTTGDVTFKASPDYEHPTDGNHDNVYNIVVTATDGGTPALSATRNVTITVTDVNDNAPLFTNGGSATATTPENVSTPVYTAAATDADGTAPNKTVTYSLAPGVSDNDQFAINPTTGAVTFKVSPDYEHPTDAGTDNTYDIVVTATDGGATPHSTTQTVAITVTNVNDNAPVANPDSYQTNEDTILTIPAKGVLTNDSDADGDPLTASAVSQPNNGQVTLNLDGSFTYKPNADFNGIDSFTYKASDGTNQSTPTTVTINVIAVNDAPVNTVPGAQTTAEDTPKAISGVSVADVDSTNLTTTLTVTHGALSVGAGAMLLSNNSGQVTLSGTAAQINQSLSGLTYTNTADYNGSDTLTVSTSDGVAPATTNTVGITVTPVADIANDAATTNEDTLVNINVNDNDSFENDGHAITAINGTAIAVNGSVAVDHGTVTLKADGTLDYNPTANYNGADSFTYTVTSGGVTETASVAVTINPVNDAPVNTVPGAQTTAEDTALPISGVSVADVDGDTLTTTLSVTHGGVSVTAGGGAVITNNGTGTVTVSGTAAQINMALDGLTYTNTADYNGADTLTVSTSDGVAAPVTNTVGITVTPVADIMNDTATTDEDTPVNIDVNHNDTFENTGHTITAINGTPITVNGTVNFTNGAVTLNPNGTLDYTPATNYNGTDSFTYTVSSGGTTETATVNVTINPVDDPPVANNDFYSVAEDSGASTFNVLTNDTDVDGGPISIQSVTNSANGTVAITNGGQSLTFTPNPNFNTQQTGQLETFTYTLNGGSTATVSVNVDPVNDAPTATGLTQSLAINEDAAATNLFTQAPTVSDIDSQTVTATLTLANAAAGVLTGAGTGTTAGGATTYTIAGSPAAVQAALAAVQFDSADNFNGTTSVAVAITDGQNGPQGTNPSGTVSITIASVNDAPAGTDKTIAGVGPHTFELADFGFTDPNDAAGPSGTNGLYAVEITSLPTSGTLTLSGQPVRAGTFIPRAQIGGGFLVFTPDNSGATATFTFQVQDDGGKDNGGQDTDQSPNTITLIPDTPPTANADNITATEAGGTANGTPGHNPTGNVVTAMGGNGPNGEVADNDAEDGAAALVVVKAGNGASPAGTDASVTSAGIAVIGSHGTLTIKADGSYTYAVSQDDAAVNALNPNQTLADTFHYTIKDTGGLTSSAAINVTIHGANDAPTPHADAVSATEAGGVNNQTAGTNPGIGTDPGFNVILGSGETITTGYDTDPDAGDTLSVVGVAAGTINTALSTGANADVSSTYGTIHINNDGSATYTVNNSNPTVQGLRTSTDILTDTFSYTVKDTGGLTANTQVTVTIHGQNDNPTAVADTSASPGARPAIEAGGTNNGTAGQTGTGNVLANDTDPDQAGETKTVQGVAKGNVGGTQTTGTGGSGVAGAFGTVTVQQDGSYVYTVDNTNPFVNNLNAGSALTDTFTYTMQDGAGAKSTSTLTVTIHGANDAPVAANGTASGNEDTNIAVTLSASDVDDWSGATYKLASLPTNGTLYLSDGTTVAATNTAYSSNSFVFKPNANYSGTTNFQFTSTDQHGATSNTATETIDVRPVADQATFTAFDLKPTGGTESSTFPQATTGGNYVAQGFSVVSDFSGGYIVAYSAIGSDSQGDSIAVQRFDYSGAHIGSEIILTDGLSSGSDQLINQAPDIHKLPNGGVLLVYQTDAGGYPNAISGVLIGPTGTITKSQFSIDNDGGTSVQHQSPSAAVFSDGSFVVVDQHGARASTPSQDVYFKLFNADGTEKGTSQLAHDADPRGQYQPEVAVLNDGTFVVTWTTDVDTNTTDQIFDYDIRAQHFSATGARLGGVISVNNTTITGDQNNPDVAALSNGGYAIIWNSTATTIKARIFDASGNGGSEITVGTAGNPSAPSIASLPDGGFLVSWTDQADTNDYNIIGQRVSAAGALVGSQFFVNGAAGNQSQTDEALALLGNGDVAATYTTQGSTASVQSKVFDVPGDGRTGTATAPGTATTLTTLNATVNDSNETLSYHLTGYTAGTMFNYGSALSSTEWVISSASDIMALKTNKLVAFVPTAGTFTLTIDAQTTDSATLSDGMVHTSAPSHAYQTIVVGIRTPGDPVFAAHDSGPFDLHLAAITDGNTAHIDTLPDNGTIALADGTAVKAGATLSAHDLAGLKFTPTDTTADHAANLIYTVSDGKTVTTETLPITVQHGTNLTLTGTAEKDVIVGGAGADTLNGAGGGNFLTGGDGADHFVFDAKAVADADGAMKLVDHVTDYSAAQGDTIDFTKLFAATPNANAHAAELIHVTEEASGTAASVSVNVAGPNAAAHWVEIAHLDGVQAGATVDVALDAANPQQVAHLHVDAWAHA